MKIVHFILVSLQWLKAIVLFDKNQIAYLHYLWWNAFAVK